jgi:dethiobiotin synthetase
VKRTCGQRIIFVTGTDTGVGKTLVTALLLQHLRRTGCRALAMKPFCSGGRKDVSLLHAIQEGELTLEEINPFYFSEPVAPLVAARKHHLSISLQEVLRRIASCVHRCQCLLVEGAGGLLVPLGEGYTVADLITRLSCEVIVVSRNRLGTINHTLLTVRALQHARINAIKVVMMSVGSEDESSRSNALILAELLGRVPVLPIGFLGRNPLRPEAVKASQKNVEKILAQILA